jgi:pyruvate dehydrogenase E2 component (dihydrolipoamide acetyltransferase)
LTAPKDSTGRILASPLAKKIAKEKNIDLLKIKGSGPHGRITKRDLGGDFPSLLASNQETAPPLRPCLLQSKKIPISKMRSVIAKRLLESKTTIPHFYLQKEINAEPLGLARQSINRRLESVANETATEKVSINDLILLACASAIPLVPEINTSWGENEIIFHGDVHLAFGVAVDDGLVTPVIRKADSLNLKTLSKEAKSLIHKSRNKKLTPDEMSGSTFTVTNLGMFGIDFFSGIINPPNAAILSVGASVPKAVVGKDGSIRSGETMTLGLSCDHRLVDGAVGARFLQTLAELLENPASLLV